MRLLQSLQTIVDPRVSRSRRHDLHSMLVMALCATLAGADNWVEVANFAQAQRQWFEKFLHLPSGIASHDTFNRVFRMLDATQLERVLQQWLSQAAGQVQGVVAIDGKSVRGSRKGDATCALHMVSAWASDMGMLLGQRKVDGKSNEIKAIPQLLELLHIQGCIVTIDAMGCQTAIAEKITQQGADYMLALKLNQRHVYTVTKKHFEQSLPTEGDSWHQEHASGHGRHELRCYRISPIPDALRRAAKDWPELQCVVQVVRQREKRNAPGQLSEQVSYYLSSLPSHTPAHVAAHSIRAHWCVENNLHWSLDVGMREDAAQSYKGQSVHNQSLLRRMALQLIQGDKGRKIGIQASRKRAGWDMEYLKSLIAMHI